MTLTERLFDAVFDNAYEFKKENVIPQCEQIADEYAKQVLVSYLDSETLQYKQSQGVYNLDELLQIIKKERGL